MQGSLCRLISINARDPLRGYAAKVRNPIPVRAALMSPTPDVIQWFAFVVGTAGSLLWAHNGPWAKYAGAFWLVASLLWVWFAGLSGMPGLAARDLVGIGVTSWGAWRWLSPAKE
jgi:hypothetical protein